MLFVNIEPEAIGDPQLRDVVTSTLLAESAIPATRVVLEITERAVIADFCAFRATLEYVRALGFTVAVDDAGAGYGSLQCITEVRPEWLKVDLSLVRGVDTDDVRASLVESPLPSRAGWVPSSSPRASRRPRNSPPSSSLGVGSGQGFLLARPSEPFPDDAELPARQLLDA